MLLKRVEYSEMVDTILVISRKNGNFRRNVRIHEAKYYLGNSKSKRSIGIHGWWDTINICIYFFFFFFLLYSFRKIFHPSCCHLAKKWQLSKKSS